jgi:HSP20 family molecular chaperone IbpA
MGAIKLDSRSAPNDFHQTVEQLHGAAFGPSPSLYRQISLCGWRPLNNARMHDDLLRHRPAHHRRAATDENEAGIEVHETDEEITIEVTLSRVEEDSLHLSISGQRVIICGEMIVARNQRGAMPKHNPKRPRFKRIIKLPATVNAGGFQAVLVDDTVRINFAKRH